MKKRADKEKVDAEMDRLFGETDEAGLNKADRDIIDTVDRAIGDDLDSFGSRKLRKQFEDELEEEGLDDG